MAQRKVEDCRGLYLRYGGVEHDRIAAEMRALGWSDFTKRNLYARTRSGRVTPGWPERFGWDGSLPAKVREKTRNRKARRRGIAYARRRNSTSAPRLSNSASKPPGTFASHRERHATSQKHIGRGHNRQKARRLLSEPPASAGGTYVANENARPGADLVPYTRRRPQQTTDPTDSTDPKDPKDSPDSSFHAWLKTQPGLWNWDLRHQRIIYDRLQAITDGKNKRLMIFMPPRHGKSELVTVRYSAWRIRRNTKLRVILGSYSQHLADNFSRKIRRVLADDAAGQLRNADRGSRIDGNHANQPNPASNSIQHGRTQKRPADTNPQSAIQDPQFPQSPFPFANRPINRVSEWETSDGGGLKAVGVGGGVTGFGADLIIIDDPVKSRAEADSKVFRERVWNWFNDDLYTRLEPGGAIILIQTRWHEDDLAGRLLNEMNNGGEHWEVVNLPAIAEAAELRNADCGLRIQSDGADPYNNTLTNLRCSIPTNPQSAIRDPQSTDPLGRSPGEALWPERFDLAAIEGFRSKMDEYSFSALYQQRPVPSEGGVFKRKWFGTIVDHAPKGLKWKRGYDLAISTKQTADYTASFRVAFDAEGNMYIDGGYRRRIAFPEQRRYMLERLKLERDTEHGVETAVHGQAVLDSLRKDAAAIGRSFKGIAVQGDKHSRALRWISIASEGRIRLVRGPWNKPFVEEACTFPHGKHDDQIDAVSIATHMFDRRGSRLYAFN
ncbi:MAG: phage terminase large subunit [Pyrinomonadaceae bacterium]|nr:phage terminase large subunit [Pyrinomonadaceae bacterium]